MYYSKIKKDNTANGKGVRTALFVSGCSLACPGCFNYELWDYKAGKEFTPDTMDEIIAVSHERVSGLSILGGDPTATRNIEMVTEICKEFKRVYPEKTIWVWSGFKLDLDLREEKRGELVYHSHKDNSNPTFYHQPLFDYIDVLVDGRWEIENLDPTILYSGSTNQRVIDVQKTMDENKIVLYSDNRNQ